MTQAICFKCGNDKQSSFASCSHCGSAPRSEEEFILSLVLSSLLSKELQLIQYCHAIKSGRRINLPENLLEQARRALNDQQLVSMLKASDPTTPWAPKAQAHNARRISVDVENRSETAQMPFRRLIETELHRNAFWVLGATTRDDRRRIVELAEQKMFELDQEACQKARAGLTNPRTRLAVEMSWLPGVSPKKATLLMEQVCQDPMAIRSEFGLPPLAHANLMAAAFESISGSDKPSDIANFINEIARLVDELAIDDVLRDLNEDRAVSGFPEIKVTDQIEEELTERKRHFRNAIRASLDRLPTASLIEAVTHAVNDATSGGEESAPDLIDTLVDSYELETQRFLEKEAENVEKLIAAARNAAKSRGETVKTLIDKLEIVVRNWHRVAQPIQLSAKARGIRHRPSVNLAFSVRSLAIDLFNEHDMLTESKRINELLQEFASEPEFAERVEQDAQALMQIERDINDVESANKEWEREITYSAEIGTLFKATLSLSPAGISWQNQRYPLGAITRVRWGAVRHSVNGIPTGTNYTIAFGDRRSEAIVDLRRGEVFTTFVDKLWQAVGIRLLTESLKALRTGEEIRVGAAAIRDDGVTLPTHKFWGSGDDVRCTWDQVHVWSADGSFYIGAKTDKRVYAALSYIEVPNAHVIEQAIRMAFKKPGMRVLSDLIVKP